jgi:uncharacterized protein YuzE
LAQAQDLPGRFSQDRVPGRSYRVFRSDAKGQIMRLRFDEKADALYLRLDDSKIVESEEVQPGIVLDFNEHNQVVGVEILRVKERVPLANLRQMQFEVA